MNPLKPSISKVSNNLIPAIDDCYFGLRVVLQYEGQADEWVLNPWIDEIGLMKDDFSWECDYATWLEKFSHHIPEVGLSTVRPCPDADLRFPPDHSVVKFGEGWAVRDERENYWVDAIGNGWSDNPSEPSVPALTFPSPQIAKAAFLQADQMQFERDQRNRVACAMLGIKAE